MGGFLKQSTASQSRALGPFVDDTDFKTAKTSLTIANTDIKLVVNGAASANKNSGGGTHRVNGVYGVTFDATDTATVGEMEVSVVVSGALPVFDKFTVLEEAVYDAMFAASAPGYVANAPVNVAQFGGSNGTFASGRPEVNLSHIAGSSVSASTAQLGVNVVNFGGSAGTFASGRPEVNTTHAAGTAWASGAITANSIASNAITAAKIADAAIDRATFAADTGFQSFRSNTAQAGGANTITLDASASASDDFYNGDQIILTGGTGANQANIITDYNGTTKVASVWNTWVTNPSSDTTFAIFPAAETSADIADAVWEEDLSEHEGTSGSVAEALATAGGSGASASDIADAVWDELLSGHTDSGSSGGRLGRLPDVAAGGSGGLLISGSNSGTTTLAALTVSGATTLNGAVSATHASNDIGGIDVAKISGDATAANNAESFFDGTGYAGTGNTIPTVTNVTNAPSAGDFTATMKASIGTAVAASAVASVTGNVGGNVTGSVGSVASNGITAASLAADAGVEIAAAVLAAAASDPIDANVQQINDVTLVGNGNGSPMAAA